MFRRIRPVSRISRTEPEIRRPKVEGGIAGEDLPGLDEVWMPAVDVYEKEEEIIVEMELPGVLKRDVKVMLSSNRVEVRGIKREQAAPAGVRYHRLEREFGTFRRVVFVPSAANPERTAATLENGILSIVLTKLARKKRKVEVKVRGRQE